MTSKREKSQSTEEEVRRAHAVTPITAIQSEYSMMEQMFEKDVIPTCQELGIGFVPFSPLGAGFLSGKYTSKDTYTGDDGIMGMHCLLWRETAFFSANSRAF